MPPLACNTSHRLSPTPIPTAPRDRADLASCSLAIRWTFDTGRCVDASPLVVKQESAPLAVYVGSHSGLFVCLGVESGLPLWQAQLSDRVESSACLSRCGGHVIVGEWLRKVVSAFTVGSWESEYL